MYTCTVVKYCIVSNLMDNSNYPDTISNYFFTSNYTGQSMKFEFLLFYSSGHRCSNADSSASAIPISVYEGGELFSFPP